MKKLILLTVCASAFAFTSCVKDRTCSCTDSSGTVSQSYTTKTTKKLAKADCDNQQTYYNSYYTGVTCELKK